ncbi:hypothetical protein [Polaribacter sp. Hel1_85]|uniref:hypothetical protein n=1 Tax=Polaribacter sp. Hel1_85 TaxID=1250005 RepID=UPI00052D96D4|nr:hypothetical protein [Polaribacter sp. Hel1_85]KGL63485.1 hypothetical protein PHEL85_0521 [Polaribacter sp. Hel1_85]
MKKLLFLGFLFFATITFGQFLQEETVAVEKVIKKVIQKEIKIDTSQYNKSIEYAEKRAFREDLKEKYDDKEFVYAEEEIEEEEEPSSINPAFAQAILFFISKIFPFLLGGIIIFIILKTFLGTETNFWNFKKSKKKVAEKLIYEEEDIHETDIDGLLQKAINNKAYRLAIRYYYLSVLKTLSNSKLIDYHKDKTNSEYLFEIENETTRTEFSYLSYVYSYVWYGDFPIDEVNFKLAENKYQSFKNSLK